MDNAKVWAAGKMINERVRNSAGEDLGKIEDLVIDPSTGTIKYAVLSLGGFLGMGNKLFAIPWSSLYMSPSRDYIILNIDKKALEGAPGFHRNEWPDMADPAWQSGINRYYGVTEPVRDRPIGAIEPVRERTIYVERPVTPPRGMPVLAAALLICLLLGALWVAFLVSTRGWDQARQDLGSSIQGAAYAMKETSQDATLTAKVKTALSLSKRIPSGKINVDSEGDVVTLRGEVPNEQVRSLAESIARDTPGVREVHNHLFAVSQLQ